jgi:hypothetical protein
MDQVCRNASKHTLALGIYDLLAQSLVPEVASTRAHIKLFFLRGRKSENFLSNFKLLFDALEAMVHQDKEPNFTASSAYFFRDARAGGGVRVKAGKVHNGERGRFDLGKGVDGRVGRDRRHFFYMGCLRDTEN